MDEQLWALLTGSAGVQEVVSDRLFLGLAPEETPLPYVTLTVVSVTDFPHMQGAGGFEQHRVQIDSYGVDRTEARAVARAIKAAINGKIAGEIQLILMDAEREFFEGGAQERPFRFSQDYIVTWRPNDG